MIRKVLIIISGIMNIFWGIAHLIPTKIIVNDFGNISIDNKRIITMEWIYEGFTLIFIGLLVLLVSIVEDKNNRITKTVYLTTAIMLIAMAILSLFTGFKINFLPFQLCPLIFSISSILIIQGVYRKISCSSRIQT